MGKWPNSKKISLRCDYIDDFDVFRAVTFAVTMIRDGTPPPIANSRAAKYYRVDVSEVARLSGQHAARMRAEYAERAR